MHSPLLDDLDRAERWGGPARHQWNGRVAIMTFALYSGTAIVFGIILAAVGGAL